MKNLYCPKCDSGNIMPDRLSPTGRKCLMCGTDKGFIVRETEQMELNFDGPALTPEQRAVWNCVKDRQGKGQEILGARISEMTGIDYTTVRAIISELRRRYGKLIGSNSRGYYVPVSKEELYEVTQSLRHRGIMILVVASKLMQSSLEDVFRQARIEFESTQKEVSNG